MKYRYTYSFFPLKRKPEQIGQSPHLELGRMRSAGLAIRKRVRGTMKWSPAAPHRGANGGDKYCINSRYNIITGVVIISYILPLLGLSKKKV